MEHRFFWKCAKNMLIWLKFGVFIPSEAQNNLFFSRKLFYLLKENFLLTKVFSKITNIGFWKFLHDAYIAVTSNFHLNISSSAFFCVQQISLCILTKNTFTISAEWIPGNSGQITFLLGFHFFSEILKYLDSLHLTSIFWGVKKISENCKMNFLLSESSIEKTQLVHRHISKHSAIFDFNNFKEILGQPYNSLHNGWYRSLSSCVPCKPTAIWTRRVWFYMLNIVKMKEYGQKQNFKNILFWSK